MAASVDIGLQAATVWTSLCAALVTGAVCAHWVGGLLKRTGHAARFSSRGTQAVLLVLMAAVAAVPIASIAGHRYSLAALATSVVGEFSSMSALLVFTRFGARAGQWRLGRFVIPLALAAAALYAGVLFYVGPDLYRWGYPRAGGSPWPPLLLLGLIALWAWRLPAGLAWLPAAAVLAWALGLQTSPNLWDYLIDVPLFILLLAVSVRQLLRRPASP